jgi:uncharacterized protein YcbX
MFVHELLIYPVKSCAGIKVDEALVTKYGLALPSNPEIADRYTLSLFFFQRLRFEFRRWMIVKDGRQRTQHVSPRMALIQPSVVKDGICLRAPNMPDLHLSVNPLPKEVLECS